MDARDRHLYRKLLAHRIRVRRAELDITQEELAGRIGLSQAYLSGIEQAKRNPSIDIIQQIAVALKLGPQAIFEKVRDR
jgi:transcriptional regulator with XRE-family HTH domain